MYGDCIVDQLNDSNAYGFVYCTTNNINGRKYIGQHKIGQHNDDRYLGSGLFFRQALKKYGRENFTREILGYASSKEELDQLEDDTIRKYDAVNSNEYYNISTGAYGHSQTSETRQQISQTLTGYKRSEETKKKMSECKKRENLSPETRRKLSERAKGRKHSEETIQKLREFGKTRVTSEETRKKISEALKGRVVSEETRARMSMARKGRPNNQKHQENAVKIRCIETGEIFESIHDADRKTGIDYRNLSAHIKGRVKSLKGLHFEKIID